MRKQMPKKIVIVTDAWEPQVNGVVRSLQSIRAALWEHERIETEVIHPGMFWKVPSGVDPEVSLVLGARWELGRRLKRRDYFALHIATEGPLGWAARSFCIRNKIPFTTAYHTRFPEYLEARVGLPARWTLKYLRHFHRPSSAVLVSTPSLLEELQSVGFENLKLWSRGVDLSLFSARPEYTWTDFCEETGLRLGRRPSRILLYVGRVAVEKNIEAFLDLRTPGLKVVVGDGPHRAVLEKKFPGAVFLGKKKPEELSRYYSLADVFVFPSRTDTFGLVLLEALACGTPVAAFPVVGPKDVIGSRGVGALSEDLNEAVRLALECSPADCRAYAETFSWEACGRRFLENLAPLPLAVVGEKRLNSRSKAVITQELCKV